ncbi:TatD family hydrolase [Thiohalobacter sp. IOR34]|uniref:TatD family hydrolase n=1 Tax=Thiohalobacter sp. IOR34 TaxID=3057176 RepID=UPI0025B0E04E|nr:TatD family hydrolase [Thiohalobacter sp. IOR34]WJW76639.1 TatD family hydrolase [Thiohalobacter sp. IOR34]
MELIDTHCHIDDIRFAADRDEVLARARRLGVKRLIVPGVTADGWAGIAALCDAQPGLYPAYGLHPLFVTEAADVKRLEHWLAGHPAVAVGEIGLDFHPPGADRRLQQRLFEAQLVVAREAGLPVVLHVRKAHEEVLRSLRRSGVRGGTAHAFNGSLQQAQRYLDLGFKLGFGGMLTYERSRRLRALARELPAEALVLETDAPDLTVAAHRGERNSPEYLPDCLQALAEVRDEPAEALAAQTTRNALEVFALEG